jgi:hypothetical protein
MSRLPHYLDNRLTDGGEVDSLTSWLAFTHQEDSWYSFLLEAQPNPRPKCSWKGYVNLKNPMTSSGIKPVTFILFIF